ncbi:hypothetical protein OIO90_001483 [Microbotryomycetes sp. JL221]|nr:hypothetical protein OIO90_001483 [Microbotryomycetes sp. JL221]
MTTRSDKITTTSTLQTPIASTSRNDQDTTMLDKRAHKRDKRQRRKAVQLEQRQRQLTTTLQYQGAPPGSSSESTTNTVMIQQQHSPSHKTEADDRLRRPVARLPSRSLLTTVVGPTLAAQPTTSTTTVEDLGQRFNSTSLSDDQVYDQVRDEQPKPAYKIRSRPVQSFVNLPPTTSAAAATRSNTSARAQRNGNSINANRRNYSTPNNSPTRDNLDVDEPDSIEQQRRLAQVDGMAKRQNLLWQVDKQLKGQPITFDAQVQTLYELQRATPKVLKARNQLIQFLTRLLNESKFRWRHSHSIKTKPLIVESFGSTRFGLSTSTSDLDLCLLDPYRPNGFDSKYFSLTDPQRLDITKLPEIYDMKSLARKLEEAGFDKVRAISHAVVPIVKFECEIDGVKIQADLNTNERLGVYNSRLIAAYCDLHPLIRPFCVFIKFWAAQRGLNDPSGQDGPISFSSYTLLLLVIAYLQHIQLVPNLQDENLIQLKGVQPQLFWSTPKVWIKSGQIMSIKRSIGWNVTFVEKMKTFEYESQQPKNLNLKNLTVGFFKFFKNFDWNHQVVSIQQGGLFKRQRPFVDDVTKLRRELSQATIDRQQTDEEEETGDEQVVGRQNASSQIDQDEDDDVDDKVVYEPPSQQHQIRDLSSSVKSIPREADPLAIPLSDEHNLDLDLELDLGFSDNQQSQQLNTNQYELDRASNSSSPIEYGQFEEPERWESKPIVTQDPFDLTRNTSGNIEPDVVDMFQKEIERAHQILSLNEKIDLNQLCQSLGTNQNDVSLSQFRRIWKRQQMEAFNQVWDEFGLTNQTMQQQSSEETSTKPRRRRRRNKGKQKDGNTQTVAGDAEK